MRHHERRPLTRRLLSASAQPRDPLAPSWEHVEGVLARWLAADSLSALCHAALDRFRVEHGFTRLLLVARHLGAPVAWALAPDDSLCGPIQDWFDHNRRRTSPVAAGGGTAKQSAVRAEMRTSPELSELGLRFRVEVVIDQRTSYDVYWSVDPLNRTAADRAPRAQERGGLPTGGQDEPNWRLLHLALANQARMDCLRELSHIDTLTGVFNRRYFNLRLMEETARARRFERPLALVIADLDQFKPLNDTRGHQVGDIVLRYVSQTVRHAVRSIDILSRLGGDEFAVLMPDTDAAECAMLGERLRRAVNDSSFALVGPGDRTVVRMRVSLGGAVFPDHADGAERLLWCADMALLEAKRRGGNRFVFHDELSERLPPGGCSMGDDHHDSP